MSLKMLKVLNGRGSYLTRGVTKTSLKRFFLSNAYKCEETWENRLKNPVFSKLDFDNLYHDLDLCFRKRVKINVLDVDLLANLASDASFTSDLENVFMQLRLCPESAILPERTSHAVIRLYIDKAPKEDILNVLGDRTRFGLFPDYYLTNRLMDKFLKDNDAVSAIKVAVLQMLQEDYDHPIMKVLALHCCYNYLTSSEVWESIKEPEPDPDEDVKKVRVEHIRPPYFDDHFDIKDTNHLVGKTLWLFGLNLGGSLGASSQLVGLALYEKYQKCASFLESAIKNNVTLHADAVKKAREYTLNKPKQSKVASEVTKEEETKPPEGKEEKPTADVDEWKSKVLQLLEKINKTNLINADLLSETSKEINRAVQENENKDIELQNQIYKQWEKERADHIEWELKASQMRKLRSEIKDVKKALEEEEQKLFYFDKEDELEMIAQQQEEKMKSVVYYRGKGKFREKSDEQYIPPDVTQKSK